MTGTPVENRLGDLWSLFDFINPGLLGTSKQFSTFIKGLESRPHNPYAPLRALVQRFQDEGDVPFMVLSLKAGGTGLNLTAASHVVHFDRWWNPAVENQATDRAFRIGQTRNVLVHKFLCRGTVEEKIDHLIDSKRRLSQDVIEGGADLLLTEMRDEELLTLVALDLKTALSD